MDIIWLIVGLFLIIAASDILVDAVSSIAIKLKIPKTLIALTVVAFGTCMPEFAISFSSIASNNGSVALANVIGSCIINIVLIIGIASITHPIKIRNETVKKELPILLIITAIFSLVLINRLRYDVPFLNRIDGIILLSSFLIFIYYLITVFRKKNQELNEEQPKYELKKAVIYITISLILIIISSELLVNSAVNLATDLGVSQKIITMIVIIIGTSLPELVMTITAAKKNEFELAIGNIIGTNIFNISVVLGLPLVIFGKVQILDFSIIDVLIVFIAALFLYIFSKSEKILSRIEGVFLVLIFIAYYGYILFA